MPQSLADLESQRSMPGNTFGSLAAQLFANDPQARKRWARRLDHKLNRGKLEALLQTLREFPPPNPELARLLANEAEYFERNTERMRYPRFRAQGLFIGSGVVEAGCKTVVGARLKQSGMFWTVRGANAILALRCNRLSGKFENYWESRALGCLIFHRYVAHPFGTNASPHNRRRGAGEIRRSDIKVKK